MTAATRLRRLKILAAMAVVAAGGLALGDGRDAPVTEPAVAPAPPAVDSAGGSALAVPRLPAQLDRLRPSAAGGPATDAFAGRSWAAPPRPPMPAVAAAAPPPPTVPPLPFVYLGKWTEEGKGTVFYLERGPRLMAVSAGEALDANYRLEGAQAGELVFTYLPMNARQTIRIGE